MISKWYDNFIKLCHKFSKTLNYFAQHLTIRHKIYKTSVDIDYLINYTELKLVQLLQDLALFLHFLFCLLIFFYHQLILLFKVFVILAYIHLFYGLVSEWHFKRVHMSCISNSLSSQLNLYVPSKPLVIQMQLIRLWQ